MRFAIVIMLIFGTQCNLFCQAGREGRIKSLKPPSPIPMTQSFKSYNKPRPQNIVVGHIPLFRENEQVTMSTSAGEIQGVITGIDYGSNGHNVTFFITPLRGESSESLMNQFKLGDRLSMSAGEKRLDTYPTRLQKFSPPGGGPSGERPNCWFSTWWHNLWCEYVTFNLFCTGGA